MLGAKITDKQIGSTIVNTAYEFGSRYISTSIIRAPSGSGQRPKIYLMEEWLFFRQYPFHKLKLIQHRASMKGYEQFLIQGGYDVQYISSTDKLSDVRQLIQFFGVNDILHIFYVDTVDNWLERRLRETAIKYGVSLQRFDTPNFLNRMDEANEFFDKRKAYFQTDFYKWQRQRRNILLETDGKPLGGKWTYDAENRKRLPKNEPVPVIQFPTENEYVQEAKQYVEKNFASNYGESSLPLQQYFYPTTFDEAKKWLHEFLQNRFSKFGVYEDAIVKNEHYLFHSVLTPMLNTGLLQPQYIIEQALEAAIDHDIPLNSLEGFIRQIMGWREYIRIVYVREGSRQRTTNYWNFTRKIPASFWKAETGIVPVDTVIKKLLKTGYTHHIERLMIMGNFFVLCEFHPDEVYRWFMEMYIDAYDWVMVPNVYGMTQFADGGLMMTKPYISSSNYILKMSDFGSSSTKGNKDADWQRIWDALFWRFMHVHRDFFSQNSRLGMLLRTFDKMPSAKQQDYIKTAGAFLDQL